MRRTRVWLIAVVGVLTLAAPRALAEEKTCSLLGSWYGYAPVTAIPGPTPVPTWMSTVSGTSNASGTIIIDLFNFDGSFGGALPVVRTALLRGAWERVNGTTFAITVLGYGIGADGRAVTVGKLSCTDKVSADCGALAVVCSLDFFWATQNPYTDAPFFSMSIAEHNAYRVEVDPL